MMYYRFYKNALNRWYIDFPSYLEDGGDIASLEMVAGADLLLDILAMGSNEVDVTFSDVAFDGANTLTLAHMGDLEGGAYYNCCSVKGVDYELYVWLCDVTLQVLGYFPDTIYFQ